MAGRAPRNFDHVEPPEIRALLKEEDQILTALGNSRQEIGEVRTKRDEQVQKEKPKHEKELEKIEKKIEAQQAKKDDAYGKMSGTNRESNKEATARLKIYDHLKIAQLELEPVRRERDQQATLVKRAELQFRSVQNEIERLKGNSMFKSVGEMEKRLRDIDSKLKRAKEKGHEDVERQLTLDRTRVVESRAKVEILADKQKQLKECKQALTSALEKLKNKQDEMAAAEKRLESLTAQKDALAPRADPEQDDKRKLLREEQYQKVLETKKVLDSLHEQKRAVLQSRSSAEVKQMDEKMTELIASRDKDKKRLDEIRALIPSTTVEIPDAETIGALVGKGGATLQELQTDFGVMIDIKRSDGTAESVNIRGGQCEDAAGAVEEILREAALSKHKEHAEFDPSLTREFIGAGGQHIQRLQTTSGASISLIKDEKGKTVDGKLVIVGKKEAVDAALQLVEEFKANNVRAVISYSADMASVIRGPLMKQWQEEYSCRSIRAEQEARTITIIGGAAAVQKASSEIEEWLKESKAGKCSLPLGNVPPQVVIGSGGQTVRLIQTETKTQVNINLGRVEIVGGKEGVAKARQMIEKLLQENQMEEFSVPFQLDMFNYLIRPRPWPKSDDEEPRSPVCLLEQIRLNAGANSVKAVKESKKILIRGKSDTARKAREALKKALDFTGQQRESFPVEGILLRHFVTRDQETGQTIVDDWRKVPGILEIFVAAPKDEKQTMEIVGEAEAVAGLKETVLEKVKELSEGIARVDIEASKLRFVIGPGGATIRRIQTEFNVQVTIDTPAAQVVLFAADKDVLEKGKAEVERVAEAGGDTRFSGN